MAQLTLSSISFSMNCSTRTPLIISNLADQWTNREPNQKLNQTQDSQTRLCEQRTKFFWEERVHGRVPNQEPKDERHRPVPGACWRTAHVRVLLELHPCLLRGNLMEQQLRRCYFSFISLRGGLLISVSKQKNTGSPFQHVPLIPQQPHLTQLQTF